MSNLIRDINDMTYDLINKHRDSYTGNKSIVTASSLASSPRKNILNKRHRGEARVSAMSEVKSFVGSMVHLGYMIGLCETDEEILSLTHNRGVVNDKYLLENRFYMEVLGQDVSAQIDIYDRENRTLINLKANNTGAWLYNDDGFIKNVAQLNCEATLLRRHGYQVDRAIVRYLFTDWTNYQLDKNRDNSYPSGLSFPYATEDMEIKLFDHDSMIERIEKAVQDLLDLQDTSDDNLPPCTRLDTGGKPPWKVYKLKKDGTPYAKSVANGSHETEEEAQKHAGYLTEDTGIDHTVIFRESLDMPLCRYYCDANSFCNQYQKSIGEVTEKEVANA
jgi:hypothetical protein